MKTSLNTVSRKLLAVLAVAVATSALLQAGCGGCPWTRSSDAQVTPATPCLQIEVSSGISSGDQLPAHEEGGCVNPSLFGTNACSEALTFPGASITAGADVVVAPGASFVVTVPLESASPRGEDYAFVVPAQLGTTHLSIAFMTFAP